MPAANNSTFASDALQYQGHAYVFGGAPGINGTDPWDCSSFMNWVLGHDFKMKLPHALKPGYDGRSHGPVVADYLLWTGAVTIPSPEAGDLCVFGPNHHIGMAVSPDKMISALNPGLGTLVTPIAGQVSVPPVFRRIAGVTGIAQNLGCMPGAGLLLWMVSLCGRNKFQAS